MLSGLVLFADDTGLTSAGVCILSACVDLCCCSRRL
jgi:hypothetical protein